MAVVNDDRFREIRPFAGNGAGGVLIHINRNASWRSAGKFYGSRDGTGAGWIDGRGKGPANRRINNLGLISIAAQEAEQMKD